MHQKSFKKDLQIERAPSCHNYESINHVHHALIYLILELCGIPVSFQNIVDYSIFEIIGSFREPTGLHIFKGTTGDWHCIFPSQ